MNTLSKKQQHISTVQHHKHITKVTQYQRHRYYRDNRKTVIDYHRIYDLIDVLHRINPPLSPRKLKEEINSLFDGIETEEEVFDAFKLFRYDAIIEDDKIILTNDAEFDERYNPAYPEPKEQYILPRYILKNFIMFRQAFMDCVMGKFPNSLDYWIYACGYLLMDNKNFHNFGLNSNMFPYIRKN